MHNLQTGKKTKQQYIQTVDWGGGRVSTETYTLRHVNGQERGNTKEENLACVNFQGMVLDLRPLEETLERSTSWKA